MFIITNISDSDIQFENGFVLQQFKKNPKSKLTVPILSKKLDDLRVKGLIRVVEGHAELDFEGLTPFQRKKVILRKKVEGGLELPFLVNHN